MRYNLEFRTLTFYGLTRPQYIRKSKQISGQTILSSPQDAQFNPNFAKNRDIPVVKNSVTRPVITCENIRFSSLFAAGDVSRRGTSATQRKKFHTDDANQCLNNKSGSHRVPNTNLSNFTCLLVDFGKVLCSSANELQQNSSSLLLLLLLILPLC